jgi:hypothetical protein
LGEAGAGFAPAPFFWRFRGGRSSYGVADDDAGVRLPQAAY